MNLLSMIFADLFEDTFVTGTTAAPIDDPRPRDGWMLSFFAQIVIYMKRFTQHVRLNVMPSSNMARIF